MTDVRLLFARRTHALRAALISLLLLANAVACVSASRIRMATARPPEGDTLFILSTASYTVTAYRRDDLIPTAAVNRAARAYERLFGGAPPNILVFLSGDGSAPVIDPPSARDTVRLAADPDHSGAHTVAHDRARAAAFLMARAWVSAAVVRAAEGIESDSAILIPTWFEVAAAILITADSSEWSGKLDQAQRLTGIAPVEALLGNRDRSALSPEHAAAMNVQSAALLEYFWERDPDVLAGLPEQVGRGTPIQVALLGRAMTDLRSVNVSWQDWYRRFQGGRQ